MFSKLGVEFQGAHGLFSGSHRDCSPSVLNSCLGKSQWTVGDPAFSTVCLPLGTSSFWIWCDTEPGDQSYCIICKMKSELIFFVNGWYDSRKTQGSSQDEKVWEVLRWPQADANWTPLTKNLKRCRAVTLSRWVWGKEFSQAVWLETKSSLRICRCHSCANQSLD